MEKGEQCKKGTEVGKHRFSRDRDFPEETCVAELVGLCVGKE